MKSKPDVEHKSVLTSHLTPLQVMAYHDGLIKDETILRQVQTHLAICPVCQGFLNCLGEINVSDEQLVANICADREEERQQEAGPVLTGSGLFHAPCP